jgi:hypothetical protein
MFPELTGYIIGNTVTVNGSECRLKLECSFLLLNSVARKSRFNAPHWQCDTQADATSSR